MDPQSLAIDATRAAIQERRTTAFALAEDFYLRIEKQDPLIGAYLTLSKERALAKAAEIDALAAKGEKLPPLGGVPVAIKDVMATRGVRT
ncbi:MAG: amidase family protein, partial [Terriglobales bacterium]